MAKAEKLADYSRYEVCLLWSGEMGEPRVEEATAEIEKAFPNIRLNAEMNDSAPHFIVDDVKGPKKSVCDAIQSGAETIVENYG
jgi:hypothetical protein